MGFLDRDMPRNSKGRPSKFVGQGRSEYLKKTKKEREALEKSVRDSARKKKTLDWGENTRTPLITEREKKPSGVWSTEYQNKLGKEILKGKVQEGVPFKIDKPQTLGALVLAVDGNVDYNGINVVYVGTGKRIENQRAKNTSGKLKDANLIYPGQWFLKQGNTIYVSESETEVKTGKPAKAPAGRPEAGVEKPFPQGPEYGNNGIEKNPDGTINISLGQTPRVLMYQSEKTPDKKDIFLLFGNSETKDVEFYFPNQNISLEENRGEAQTVAFSREDSTGNVLRFVKDEKEEKLKFYFEDDNRGTIEGIEGATEAIAAVIGQLFEAFQKDQQEKAAKKKEDSLKTDERGEASEGGEAGQSEKTAAPAKKTNTEESEIPPVTKGKPSEGKEKPEEEKKISALKEKALRVKAENENNPAPDILLQTIEDGYYTPEQMEKIAELIFDPRVSVEKSFTNNDKKIGFTVNIKKTNTFLMNFILGEDNPWELVEKRMTKTNTKLQKLSPEVE